MFYSRQLKVRKLHFYALLDDRLIRACAFEALFEFGIKRALNDPPTFIVSRYILAKCTLDSNRLSLPFNNHVPVINPLTPFP